MRHRPPGIKKLTEPNEDGDSLIMGIAFVLVFTGVIVLAFHALA